MITINPSVAFILPTAYIHSFAIRTEYEAQSLNPPIFSFLDEIGGFILYIEVTTKIDAGKGRELRLDEIIKDAYRTELLTGLTSTFDIDVRVVPAPVNGQVTIEIVTHPSVEAPTFVELPQRPRFFVLNAP